MSKGFLFVLLAGSLSAENLSWDWLGGVGAPCKGVGITGSFRVHVRAEVDTAKPSMRKITALSVYASGAVIDAKNAELTGTVWIEDAKGNKGKEILLRPQEPNSIGEGPKLGETTRKYLPNDSSLEGESGAKLAIRVNVVVKKDAGLCSLGATIDKKEL